MAKKAPPKPPANLRRGGAALWRRIVGVLALEPWELEHLRLACEQRDLADDLAKHLDEEGMIVPGSAGQPTLNKAVGELRAARQAVSSHLARLKWPADAAAGHRPGTFDSGRARAAAMARWHG